jgi:hypothetical protein
MPPVSLTPVVHFETDLMGYSGAGGKLIHGPVLLATAAKLGIRQERGTREKPSQ